MSGSDPEDGEITDDSDDDIPVAELKKERQAKLLQMKNAKTLSQKAQQDSLDSFGRRYRSESPSAKKARLTQEFYTVKKPKPEKPRRGLNYFSGEEDEEEESQSEQDKKAVAKDWCWHQRSNEDLGSSDDGGLSDEDFVEEEEKQQEEVEEKHSVRKKIDKNYVKISSKSKEKLSLNIEDKKRLKPRKLNSFKPKRKNIWNQKQHSEIERHEDDLEWSSVKSKDFNWKEARRNTTERMKLEEENRLDSKHDDRFEPKRYHLNNLLSDNNSSKRPTKSNLSSWTKVYKEEGGSKFAGPNKKAPIKFSINEKESIMPISSSKIFSPHHGSSGHYNYHNSNSRKGSSARKRREKRITCDPSPIRDQLLQGTTTNIDLTKKTSKEKDKKEKKEEKPSIHETTLKFKKSDPPPRIFKERHPPYHKAQPPPSSIKKKSTSTSSALIDSPPTIKVKVPSPRHSRRSRSNNKKDDAKRSSHCPSISPSPRRTSLSQIKHMNNNASSIPGKLLTHPQHQHRERLNKDSAYDQYPPPPPPISPPSSSKGTKGRITSYTLDMKRRRSHTRSPPRSSDNRRNANNSKRQPISSSSHHRDRRPPLSSNRNNKRPIRRHSPPRGRKRNASPRREKDRGRDRDRGRHRYRVGDGDRDQDRDRKRKSRSRDRDNFDRRRDRRARSLGRDSERAGRYRGKQMERKKSFEQPNHRQSRRRSAERIKSKGKTDKERAAKYIVEKDDGSPLRSAKKKRKREEIRHEGLRSDSEDEDENFTPKKKRKIAHDTIDKKDSSGSDKKSRKQKSISRSNEKESGEGEKEKISSSSAKRKRRGSENDRHNNNNKQETRKRSKVSQSEKLSSNNNNNPSRRSGRHRRARSHSPSSSSSSSSTSSSPSPSAPEQQQHQKENKKSSRRSSRTTRTRKKNTSSRVSTNPNHAEQHKNNKPSSSPNTAKKKKYKLRQKEVRNSSNGSSEKRRARARRNNDNSPSSSSRINHVMKNTKKENDEPTKQKSEVGNNKIDITITAATIAINEKSSSEGEKEIEKNINLQKEENTIENNNQKVKILEKNIKKETQPEKQLNIENKINEQHTKENLTDDKLKINNKSEKNKIDSNMDDNDNKSKKDMEKNSENKGANLSNLEDDGWTTVTRKANEDSRSVSPTKEKNSEYRGVVWDLKDEWVAFVYHEGERLIVGNFADELVAARAVNKSCLDLDIGIYNPQLQEKIKEVDSEEESDGDFSVEHNLSPSRVDPSIVSTNILYADLDINDDEEAENVSSDLPGTNLQKNVDQTNQSNLSNKSEYLLKDDHDDWSGPPESESEDTMSSKGLIENEFTHINNYEKDEQSAADLYKTTMTKENDNMDNEILPGDDDDGWEAVDSGIRSESSEPEDSLRSLIQVNEGSHICELNNLRKKRRESLEENNSELTVSSERWGGETSKFQTYESYGPDTNYVSYQNTYSKPKQKKYDSYSGGTGNNANRRGGIDRYRGEDRHRERNRFKRERSFSRERKRSSSLERKKVRERYSVRRNYRR